MAPRPPACSASPAKGCIPPTQVLAFCLPLEVLADAVSMGTLFAFSVVCVGVAWRARCPPPALGPGSSAEAPAARPPSLLRLAAPAALALAAALAAGVVYGHAGPERLPQLWPALAGLGAAWALATALLHASPVSRRPAGFAVPLNPWLPCFGAGCSVFLCGTMSSRTWVVWAVAQVGGLLLTDRDART